MGKDTVSTTNATGCDFDEDFAAASRQAEGQRHDVKAPLSPLYQFDKAGFVPYSLDRHNLELKP